MKKNNRLATLILLAFAISLMTVTPLWAEESNSDGNAAQVEVLTGENLSDEISTNEETYGDEETTVNDEVYEEDEEEEIVLTPDSFLYVFKAFFEKLQLFFTFEDEKRAELLMQIANERLLEADLEAEKGNLELVKKLLEEYEAALEKANEALAEDVEEETVSDSTYPTEEADEEEETVTDEVYKYKAKNIVALTKVLAKVPDHVKPVIERNLQKAIAKQQAHLEKQESKEMKKEYKAAAKELKEEYKNNNKQSKLEANVSETPADAVYEENVSIETEIVNESKFGYQQDDSHEDEDKVDSDKDNVDEKEKVKQEKKENNGSKKSIEKSENKNKKDN